jgi:hypothetical protein
MKTFDQEGAPKSPLEGEVDLGDLTSTESVAENTPEVGETEEEKMKKMVEGFTAERANRTEARRADATWEGEEPRQAA